MTSTAAAATSSTSTSSTPPGDQANLEELQETVSRLISHKGVQVVLILNRRGDIVMERGTSTASPDNNTTNSSAGSQQLAKWTKQMLQIAQSYLQTLQPDDQVSFMQIRSTSHQDIMISPHQGYVLAVLKRE